MVPIIYWTTGSLTNIYKNIFTMDKIVTPITKMSYGRVPTV